MPSGKLTGSIGGAAQGASTGFMVGGPFGAAIGAGIGLFGGFLSGSAKDAQFKNQQAWAKYNANMQYQTDLFNIKNNYALSAVGAAATMAAASVNATTIKYNTEYNAAMIYSTTQYNQELAEVEMTRLWEDQDLDLEQLELFRLRERGGIVADQAASGTVIDDGTNKEVVISQTAQRAMDANIIRYGADRKAADISNQMARSSWEGQVAIQQTMYEGELNAWNIMSSAQIQAGATMGAAELTKFTDTYSAKQKKWATGVGIQNNVATFNRQNYSQMTSGLFSAAGSFAGSYFKNKPFGGGASLSAGSATRSTNFRYMGNNQATRLLPRNIARSGPGTSLVVQ